MKALMARKTDEMDVLTATVATALSISFSADALSKWYATRGIVPAQRAPMDAATLGQMMVQFPGSFKVN